MKIAVNTIFLQKDKLEGYGYFVQEIFKRIAKKYAEHDFYFLFDREYDNQFIFSPNIHPVIIRPKARHALSFKYWYDVKLPLALRSIQPDIIIQPFGFCSLTTNIPQLLVVHDVAFLHYPKQIPAHHLLYYKFFTKSFLQKATRIATVSEFSKNDIIKKYPAVSHKIDLVYSAAKDFFIPLNTSFRHQIKIQYAEGNEYFLFVGGIHPRKNLMNVLKAFSLFKKWQRSNMKLLVAGRLAWQYSDIIEKLKTYKHKTDVILLGYVEEEELAKIMASAYGLVFASLFEGFGVPIIEAMQCGIPVITSSVSSMPEIAGDAALYADPLDYDAIAQKMMLLYKDEKLRNELVEKGFEQCKKFNWDITAQLMWDSIIAITKK